MSRSSALCIPSDHATEPTPSPAEGLLADGEIGESFAGLPEKVRQYILREYARLEALDALGDAMGVSRQECH
jgi:hypothetical protein